MYDIGVQMRALKELKTKMCGLEGGGMEYFASAVQYSTVLFNLFQLGRLYSYFRC